MTTIRTFVGIELTAQARQVVTGLQNRLKAIAPPHTVRWDASQNIHLTLHFLGNILPDDVENVKAALETTAATTASFKFALGQLGCFPNLRRPRIVWVGVWKNAQPLIDLHTQLGDALQIASGFTPETRPYSPHVTIGRVKQGVPARHLRQFSLILEREQAVGKLIDMPVTAISLFKSELKPTGAIYTPLSRASLYSS